ncbi:MAG: putative sulfate exporter family transporter [Methylobacteriaceae bacterium]|nr:putative sulfate exporter family transporter [Methylobacteriaceae bacterium]
MTAQASPASWLETWRGRAPGLALALAVALMSVVAAPVVKAASHGLIALPDMVMALILGIALHRAALTPLFQAGLTYAVKTLLRYAIALLGLRIALGDIIGLGAGVVAVVIAAMAITLVSGVVLARLVGRETGLGALAGAANAVCGASATLATATVVPDYKSKHADIAFTVVMANAISTLAMLAYPPLCAWLGLSPRQTGVMFGVTIQDMAQVVGAGYAVSDPVGDVAVIVKLFRVLLLLPVVLAIGAWFARRGSPTGEARVPAPLFAAAFIALAIVNTIVGGTSLAASFAPLKATLIEASRWGLLVAIAALGLGTSVASLAAVGWRHLAVFCGAALVVLAIGLGGAMLVG